MYWRATGHYDSNGNFIKPITFIESALLAKDELDGFLELDRLFAIRKAQALKQKGIPSNAKKLRRKK